MKNGKLVIISPFFYPEPISTGKYNTHLTKHLRNRWSGDIEVICLHPFYPQWSIVPSGETLEGVTIHRGGLGLVFPTTPLFRRILLEVYFYFYVRRVLRKLMRDSSIAGAICVVPPSLFADCSRWLQAKGIPTVGIVHDLQSVHAKASSTNLGKLIGTIIELVETSLFSRFRHVIFLSNKMRSRGVSELGLSIEKSSVHYPFVTAENATHAEGETSSLVAHFPPQYHHIVYSGALGEKQNPEALYDFLSTVVLTNEDWMAHVFSSGASFERLELQNENPRVFFHPLVPEELVDELLRRSDIQVVPQAPGTEDGSLPSKLPNIIKSGALVLNIASHAGEVASIVRRFDVGVTTGSWDRGALMDGFRSIKDRSRPAPLGRVPEEFTVNALIDRVLHEFMR